MTHPHPPVLVIDDEPTHRRLLEIGLAAEGFAVHACADARSALAWLDRSTASAIISDWRLPGLHGLPMLRALRAASTAPLVLMSAYRRGAQDIEDGLVDAIVEKPFDIEELVARLRRLVREQRDMQTQRRFEAVRLAHILIVEDNPADVELIQEALEGGRFANSLDVVGDGEHALDFVFRRGRYADARRPDLILLDLNLPGLSGFEVLDALKADEEARSIPVVVLTTSDAQADVLGAYRRQANCFITKPFDVQRFIEVVRDLESFWMGVVALPRTGD